MHALYEALAAIGYTHPLHPAMTHLPIGLVMASLIFGLMARSPRYPDLATTARHCITLALAGAFPTVLTGFMDWQQRYGGAWLVPIQVKLLLASVLLVLLSTTVLLHMRTPPKSKVFLLMYALCFSTVAGIGYFGGELVFAQQQSGASEGGSQVRPPAGKVTYADVAQILTRSCTMCHAGPSPAEELRLDTYEDVMRGGEDGPVVIAGKPAESELVRRVKGLKQPSMPMGQPLLPADEIQVIEQWISQGAPPPGLGSKGSS